MPPAFFRACAIKVLSLALMAAAIVGPAARAASPLTIAQLARDEGWDPDYRDSPSEPPNLASRIPRDFPLPPGSHDLQASNVMPNASVTGTAQQALAFYDRYFAAGGWHVDKRIATPGLTAYVACDEARQCVNISAVSVSAADAGASRIKLMFFKTGAVAPK